MLPSVRYKCRYVVIWSVLLLLQQFQLVLLLNINLIGKNAKVREKRGFSTNARQNIKSSQKATLKSSSALKNRVKVISRLGPKLKIASTHLQENSKVSFKKAIYNSKVKPNRHLKKLVEPANKRMRCRRMTKDPCSIPNQDLIKKAFGYNGTTDLPNKWKDQYDELLSEFNMTKGQIAVVGVRQSDKFVYNMSAKIADIRKSEIPPIPKKDSNKPDKINKPLTNVMHTEQYLFLTMNDSLENCHKKDPCEVFLYTKLSPCTQHSQEWAESCMKYIVDTCKEWFLQSGTRCHVAFEKFFNNNEEVFTSEWDDYLGRFMGNGKFANEKDKLLSDLNGFSKETINNINELLEANAELVRENLVEKMANEGYKKLTNKLNVEFRDTYNNALKYLKDEKPNMANLVDKFKNELLNYMTNINEKTRNQLTTRFQNMIDNWNAVFLRETLNKFAAKRTVISDITELAGGIETNFIDFSLLK